MRTTLPAFILCFILCLTLAACGAAPDTTSPTDSNAARYEIDETLPAGNFGTTEEGAFSGDVYVRGYAETETIDEPFCMENCKTFEYVFFTVEASGSDGLSDFLPQNDGNAYTGHSSIGLGCIDDGIITYSNQSDAQQMKEMSLSPEVSQAIMDSSERKQIVLHLSKLPLSGGTEAPACYSHFTTIELGE